MSTRQQRKLLFGLFVASLILTISFSVYPAPRVNAQSGIWDSCESLSSSNRVWYTPSAGASLSIDTSVQSSLGTGSVRVDIPASSSYDLYVQEWFGQSPTVLSDFTAARPESVFVEGSRAVEWRIEIVTRESSGYAWNVHVVADQTVPAWTLTEIQLDYSAISNAALQMVGPSVSYQ